jgi:Flp pilus assembly pilin Flp
MSCVSRGDAIARRGDMKRFLIDFLRAREGVTSIEYALIAVLLAVVAIAGVNLLGSKVNTNFQYINSTIN